METKNETLSTNDLPLVQQKVLLLLSQMRPYDKIEVKMTENEVTVVSTSTTKETFPL